MNLASAAAHSAACENGKPWRACANTWRRASGTGEVIAIEDSREAA